MGFAIGWGRQRVGVVKEEMCWDGVGEGVEGTDVGGGGGCQGEY